MAQLSALILSLLEIEVLAFKIKHLGYLGRPKAALDPALFEKMTKTKHFKEILTVYCMMQSII